MPPALPHQCLPHPLEPELAGLLVQQRQACLKERLFLKNKY